ncbi:MAG: hypothetical protein JXC32_00765, partial [Anaerolineae bacterium]|nr:hypothetical protein [Anaerolineae bacterium]
ENVPYQASSKRLQAIVRTGEYIGELTFASLTKGFAAQHYGYEGRRAWLSTPELGGSGAWLLNGIHSVAELRFVLGEVATVYMQEHKASSFERRDVEATMSGLLTLETGVPVWVTQTAETRIPHGLRGFGLYGDAGVVRAGVDGYEVYTKALASEDAPRRFSYSEFPLSSYAQEMDAFADYVMTGRAGPTTARSERRSLAIVQAGYESARSGLPVDLKARFGDL